MTATESSEVDGVMDILLGSKFQTFYHILLRIICLSTLLTQIALIDYYLIAFNESLYWYLWLIPDVLVLGLFVTSVTLTYMHLKPRLKNRQLSKWAKYFGDTPVIYVTWFIYAIVLASKICILFEVPNGIAMRLKEEAFFGPNMLKTAVSLSSIIFYVLVLSCHDAASHSPQYLFVNVIVGSLYLDLLDATQFLEIQMHEPEAVENHTLHYVILAIVTFNFVIPTEALIVLCRTGFGKHPYSRKFQFFHKIMFMIALNAPFFAVRLAVWHLHDHNISVFLIKNLIFMGMAVRDIHEFIIDVTDTFEIKEKFRDLEINKGEQAAMTLIEKKPAEDIEEVRFKSI